MASRRAIIEPGGTLRVGRTDRADLVVSHDEEMLALHLELQWDGARCLLRSSRGAQKTLVNGVAAGEAEVPHGAWIRAGTTDFSFYIEESTPPRRGTVDTSPEAQTRAQRILNELRAQARGAPLFAVLDAARGDRIVELLRESVDTYRSLYDGIQGVAMEDAAPYLVQLSEPSKLLERLVEEGWGKRWGVYLACRSPFADVRRHFRRFLFVEEFETRARMYFRFYDPWVLRIFLPICTPRQTFEFFGEIQTFFVEGKTGEILRFAMGTGESRSAS
jgi:hypothetical protein